MKIIGAYIISFAVKAIFLVGLHCMVYILSFNSSYMVSDHLNRKVTLSDSQSELTYCYVPKKTKYFQLFADATSGRWFEKIRMDSKFMYIDRVDVYMVDIMSKSQDGQIMFWESVKSDNAGEFLLKEVDSSNKITPWSYLGYHIWKLILLFAVWVLLGWCKNP